MQMCFGAESWSCFSFTLATLRQACVCARMEGGIIPQSLPCTCTLFSFCLLLSRFFSLILFPSIPSLVSHSLFHSLCCFLPSLFALHCLLLFHISLSHSVFPLPSFSSSLFFPFSLCLIAPFLPPSLILCLFPHCCPLLAIFITTCE